MEEFVRIPENTLSVTGPLHPMDTTPDDVKQVLESKPDCVSLWLKQVSFDDSNGTSDGVLVNMVRKLLEDRLWDQICLTDCSGNLNALSTATSCGYSFESNPATLEGNGNQPQNRNKMDGGREATKVLPSATNIAQPTSPSVSTANGEAGNVRDVSYNSSQQLAPEHLLFCKTRKLCLLQWAWRGPSVCRATPDNVIYKQEFWDALGYVLGSNNLAPYLTHLGLYFDSTVKRLNWPMVQPLAKGIANNSSLQEIHLSHVSFENIETVQTFSDGMKHNKHLRCLGLYHCHFDSRNSGDSMFWVFLNSIQDHPTLSKLIVNHTHCKGTAAVAGLLSCSKNLKNLRMQYPTTYQGAAFGWHSTLDTRSLADALKVNVSLETLDLCHSGLYPNSMKYLADALMVNTTLRELRLENNHFDDTALCSLGAALPYMKGLRILRMHLNEAPQNNDAMEALVNGMKSNYTLTEFFITKPNSVKLEPYLSEVQFFAHLNAAGRKIIYDEKYSNNFAASLWAPLLERVNRKWTGNERLCILYSILREGPALWCGDK